MTAAVPAPAVEAAAAAEATSVETAATAESVEAATVIAAAAVPSAVERTAGSPVATNGPVGVHPAPPAPDSRGITPRAV